MNQKKKKRIIYATQRKSSARINITARAHREASHIKHIGNNNKYTPSSSIHHDGRIIVQMSARVHRICTDIKTLAHALPGPFIFVRACNILLMYIYRLYSFVNQAPQKDFAHARI